MIEEQGLVIAIEADVVVVQTQRASTCGSCSAKKGCGTSVLAEGLGKGVTNIRIVTDQDVKVGDRVTLAINESALLKGSLFIYLLPLAAMILAALLGEYCANLLSINTELLSAIFGVVGLVGSFLFTRLNSHARQFQQRIQPKIQTIVQ